MKVTEKKMIANRANSRKSTGPKTESGKAAVARNRTTHGLRSLKPVIPEIEKAEDWELHRQAIIDQLAPSGALELMFAERIALGSWRLGRAVVAESSADRTLREKERWRVINNCLVREGHQRCNDSPEQALDRLKKKRDEAKVKSDIWDAILKPDDGGAEVNEADAIAIVKEAATGYVWSKIEDQFRKSIGWPPQKIDQLRSMLWWLARQISDAPTTWFKDQAEKSRTPADELSATIERIEKKAEEATHLALMTSNALERIARYENSIHRTMIRDLHELQRLQALRAGVPVVAPIAVDVTTSAD